jgi:hypothetical protein
VGNHPLLQGSQVSEAAVAVDQFATSYIGNRPKAVIDSSNLKGRLRLESVGIIGVMLAAWRAVSA